MVKLRGTEPCLKCCKCFTVYPKQSNLPITIIMAWCYLTCLVLKGNLIYQHHLSGLEWTLGPAQGCKWVVERSGLAHPALSGSEWVNELQTGVALSQQCFPWALIDGWGQWHRALDFTSRFAHGRGHSHRPLCSKSPSNPEPSRVLPRALSSRRCKKTSLWTGRDSSGAQKIHRLQIWEVLSPSPGYTSLIFWWCLVHVQGTPWVENCGMLSSPCTLSCRLRKNSIKTWL